MKTKLVFYYLFGLLFLLPFLSFADTKSSKEIEIEGRWSDTGERSLFSSRPVVYLSGNSVNVYFPGAVANVTIKITDFYGNLVYEEVVSSRANTYYLIPCLLDEGDYTISLSHRNGWLIGSFKVE